MIFLHFPIDKERTLPYNAQSLKKGRACLSFFYFLKALERGGEMKELEKTEVTTNRIGGEHREDGNH